jgi:hypothetical protein
LKRQKKKQLKVASTRSFPDPLAPFSTKITEDYGLKMAKLIEYEWFYIKGGNSASNFFDRNLKFDKLRRYARGEQSTDLYKKLIGDGVDGSTYSNYDWRPIQTLPKYIKLVVSQMIERLYEIDAQAIDGISQGLRDDFKDILRKNMVSKSMLEDSKELFNIDLMPGGEIPDSEEELQLHMKLKYKPSIEIAIEEALKYTLQYNGYPEIQRQILLDLVTIGISSVNHSTDPTKGLKVEYRDVADSVWSYPELPDFANVYYDGYVKRMTLNELQRISGKKFTNEELEKFKNVSSEWQSYNRISNQFWYRGEDLPNYLVDVLFFSYKTTKVTKYKKKYRRDGGFTITEREDDFEKPDTVKEQEEATGKIDFDVLEDSIDTIFKGSLVLGSDMLFNYGEEESMIRPEGFIKNDVMSSTVFYAPEIYQGRIQSLTERAVQTIDQLQQIKIKIQQFIAKAKPNGIWLDVDGLQEVDLGEGQFFSPLELVKYYDQTGNLIGTSKLAEGGFNNGYMPIKELNNGGISGLQELMSAYNFHLSILGDDVGIGAGADASLPDPRTAVRVQEQVQVRSNVATRYILEGQLSITQRLCDGLALRLKDIFKHSNLKDAYINSIGKINVDVIKSLGKLHLHDYGITIKLKPDAQERAMLEQNIQAEIGNGGISTTDGIDIRKVGNLSLANEMLKIRKNKHEAKVQERELEKIRAQGESNAQASQAASQSKQAEIQLTNQGKKDEKLLERDNIITKIREEKKANMELMQMEYSLKFGEQAVIATNKQRESERQEDRKDKRTAIQATQQSKMKQATDGDSPIDFQSDYSSVDGDINVNTLRV